MSATTPMVTHRVLLVDDDGAVRAMMNEGLTRKGFEGHDSFQCEGCAGAHCD